jgi:hypothetical protein
VRKVNCYACARPVRLRRDTRVPWHRDPMRRTKWCKASTLFLGAVAKAEGK